MKRNFPSLVENDLQVIGSLFTSSMSITDSLRFLSRGMEKGLFFLPLELDPPEGVSLGEMEIS